MASDTQNTLGRRLRMEMKKRGISSVELAKRADVKTSFLYDVISGKSANPSSIKLARVAEALGVNLTYLAGTSDSPMEGYQFSLPQELQDYFTVPSLSVVDGRLSVQHNATAHCQFRKEWIKQALGVVAADLRMLTVQGDHMQSSLCHGDTVLVDTSKSHPSPPGVFLLFDGVALSIKRLEMVVQGDKRHVRVSADNPKYAAYETALDDLYIVGRIIWFSRQV